MDKLLKVKNNEIEYFGHNLTNLAKKHGTPLKITFLDIIKERVLGLKDCFKEAIKAEGYSKKFFYLNANKANYGVREIETAFTYSDGLETSSYYDLLLTYELYKKHPEFKKKPIVCNGYKEKDYIDAIIRINEEGYKIINVIDSLNEYEYLKEKNVKLEIGLRVHLKALYAEEGDVIENDRFGLIKEDFTYIVDDIKNTSLILSTIHFHQRGFDYEKDKFNLNFTKAFEEYYVYAAKKYKTVINFDMGGGTPLPEHNDFDYLAWAKEVISTLKKLSLEFKVNEPNLVSENGKYSQKDSTVNIYKVVGKKNTDSYLWHIINGSLLIALPEMYALGEPIIITPLNELDKPMIKGRLGGITCDCDDVYYEKSKGYIDLPDTNDDIYVGLIGTGSYQNSMNGKGGVHHCLLPEEKDLLIYTKNKKEVEEVRSNLQSIEDVLRVSKFY